VYNISYACGSRAEYSGPSGNDRLIYTGCHVLADLEASRSIPGDAECVSKILEDKIRMSRRKFSSVK